METTVFYVIIALIIGTELFTLYASHLNNKSRYDKIPNNVKDVYDEDDYAKWLDYSKEKYRLSKLIEIPRFVFILVMLLSGGFVALAEWSREVGNANPYLETLLFIGVLIVLSFLYKLPFRYYETFSIEERYDFNKTTKKTFVSDSIKAFVLILVFGAGLISLLTWIYVNTGQLFILYAFIAILIVFLFINITYTTIWVPLFNKLTPLEDNELKARIETFAEKQNYQIKKIHVMDASRRSSKLNAFFSGFGRFKNVVLFDTLLDKMDDDAILAVLAHEIAHAKHKDVLKNIFFTMLNLAVMLTLLYAFISIELFANALGLEAIHFGFMLLIFSFVVSPIGLIIGLISNTLSRQAEHKADAFAAKEFDHVAMIAALKILSRENFSQLTPHPLYVFIHYSHPPVSERIAFIDVL